MSNNLSQFRPRMINTRMSINLPQEDAQLLQDIYEAADALHSAKGKFTNAFIRLWNHYPQYSSPSDLLIAFRLDPHVFDDCL